MLVSLEVPTFHVGYTITTDNLDKLYKQVKSKGVTMTALLAKSGCQHAPEASFSQRQLRQQQHQPSHLDQRRRRSGHGRWRSDHPRAAAS